MPVLETVGMADTGVDPTKFNVLPWKVLVGQGNVDRQSVIESQTADFGPGDVGVNVTVTEHPEVVVTIKPGVQVVRAKSTANEPS